MTGVRQTASHTDRGTDDFVSPQHPDQETDGHDVTDRVLHTDFVKVNFSRRGTVSRGFCLSNPLIDRSGVLPYVLRNTQLINNRQHISKRRMAVMVMMVVILFSVMNRRVSKKCFFLNAVDHDMGVKARHSL